MSASTTARQHSVENLLETAVGALGGAPRQGQIQMANSVAEALSSGNHLLIQAGTGTGKSLGYLVPAVNQAVSAQERIIVSTATLALQRQIMTRDLPLVADALAPKLPRKPAIALLKGWNNYACLHKVNGGYPADEPTALFDLSDTGSSTEPVSGAADSADGTEEEAEAGAPETLAEQVRRLQEWVQATETGDRDDLVPGVSERAWRQVSLSKLECLGSGCPLIDECFPENARQTAFEADIVVTNHTMLGIFSTGSPNVLPEFDSVIIDEAHELVDRVTSAATAELTIGAIDHAARLARRNGGVTTGQLDHALENYGSALTELPEQSFPNGLPEEAQYAVEAVRDAAREILTQLKPKKEGEATDSGLKVAHAAMLQIFEIAERIAAHESGRDVLWCSRPRFGGEEGMQRLNVAPLAVNGLLSTNLWSTHTGILTSATLSLGHSFDPVARTLGIDHSVDTEKGVTRSWTSSDAGSPFDYPKQGILYIAKDLPTPGQTPTTDSQLDTIAELITAAGGRTLGLFSSRRAAEAATEAMRSRLNFPILCQGEDQLPTLVRKFAQDPEACLFGTLSLWQGVDVPGPSCQLVIMDRIPFPRPDDPVKSARSRAIAAAGGNGFMQVSASHAALLLAQGAGRLVRTVTDRGVVAVLDPRLATARYGAFLVGSMPDFWQTTQKNVALGALERLNSQH